VGEPERAAAWVAEAELASRRSQEYVRWMGWAGALAESVLPAVTSVAVGGGLSERALELARSAAQQDLWAVALGVAEGLAQAGAPEALAAVEILPSGTGMRDQVLESIAVRAARAGDRDGAERLAADIHVAYRRNTVLVECAEAALRRGDWRSARRFANRLEWDPNRRTYLIVASAETAARRGDRTAASRLRTELTDTTAGVNLALTLARMAAATGHASRRRVERRFAAAVARAARIDPWFRVSYLSNLLRTAHDEALTNQYARIAAGLLQTVAGVGPPSSRARVAADVVEVAHSVGDLELADRLLTIAEEAACASDSDDGDALSSLYGVVCAAHRRGDPNRVDRLLTILVQAEREDGHTQDHWGIKAVVACGRFDDAQELVDEEPYWARPIALQEALRSALRLTEQGASPVDTEQAAAWARRWMFAILKFDVDIRVAHLAVALEPAVAHTVLGWFQEAVRHGRPSLHTG
jgi:hypothetical protein